MKKFISFILSIIMVLSVNTAFASSSLEVSGKSYPQKFWDVPKDHWAFNYIAELVNKGVLAGYEDGSFKPDATVTRAEWAKIMVLAAGLPTSDNNVYFTDMKNHWANIYVNTAKNYLAAYTDGTFKPDQAAVREDVTVSLVKLKGYDINNVDYSYLSQFKDTNSVSNSLKAYVAVAIQNNLISGFEDNTFRGQDTLTRAEAATLLWKAFQSGSNNKVVDTPNTPVSNTTSTVTPEPTEKPKETNTDKEEQKNNNEQKETQEPTPTPEPEIEIKPYKVDTLKQVRLNNDFAYSKDKIYYIDNTDICELDPYTGKTNVVYSTDDLTLEKEDEVYSDYTATQVKYDDYNNRLIMAGYYSSHEKAFEILNNNCYYVVAYDVTNDKVFWESTVDNEDVDAFSFKCFLPGNKAIVNHTKSKRESYFIVDTNSNSKIQDFNFGHTFWNIGSNIYTTGKDYDSGRWLIRKFNFSESNWDDLFKLSSSNCYITSFNNNLYYWDVNNNENIYKVDVSNGKIEALPVSFNSEKCEILDMSRITGGNFVPFNDNFVVFYDTTSKAFRMISENK